MLIDHPPRPLISPLSSHLSYPSDTSFSFAFLPASSLAFYRVGARWEIAAEDRLLSTFLPPPFFISLQDFQFLPATPSNASILRAWILENDLNYARLFFFFFFFEKNLRDCKKNIGVYRAISKGFLRPPIERPSSALTVTNGDVGR